MMKYILLATLILSCNLYAVDSVFYWGGTIGTVKDAFLNRSTSGSPAYNTRNYGYTTDDTISRFVVSWGSPRHSGYTSVAYCSCGIYVAQTDEFGSDQINIYEMLRPVYDFTGTGNGTAAASSGQNAGLFWRENSSTDSTWRTTGADGASDAGTWNRGTGTSGYDRKSTAMGTIDVGWASDWFVVPCDTAWVTRFCYGTNDEAAVLFASTGVARMYTAQYTSGEEAIYKPILTFKLVYPTVAASKGSGRFGRNNSTGAYLNDR